MNIKQCASYIAILTETNYLAFTYVSSTVWVVNMLNIISYLFFFFTNANIIEIFPVRISQFSGNCYGQIIAPCDKPLCLEKGCMIWQKKNQLIHQLNLSISILIREYDSRLGWHRLMAYFADRINLQTTSISLTCHLFCQQLPQLWRKTCSCT